MSKLNVKEMAESKKAAGDPCRNIVRRRVSRSAYIRAIETEGAHVATAEGESWWREQERKHPFICAGGNRPEGTNSPNGAVNRLGRVSRRFTVARGWEKFVGGVWEKVEKREKKRDKRDRRDK
jgi:hypothetical protein